MTSNEFSPLHLEAPRLTADAALGEHLAALARASIPSAASRVRRSEWRVPLAAVATIAASGGVAYAGQVALHERIGPASGIVPANAAIVQAAAGAAEATTAAALAAVRAVPAIPAIPAAPSAGKAATNPHGKVVGRGHPKTGRKLGHPGRHDAGNQAATIAPAALQATTPLWRKSAGKAGVLRP